MSKEYLEALENLKQQAIAFEHDKFAIKVANGNYTTLKQALQRLESIDNAKPSEALKWLEKYKLTILFNTTIVENALLKAQEQERVLEIIKEKNVNFEVLGISNNVNCYNKVIVRYSVCYKELTEEEFDTLKRWHSE